MFPDSPDQTQNQPDNEPSNQANATATAGQTANNSNKTSSDLAKGASSAGVPALNEKIFVRELQDKQIFHSIFLVRDKALLNGKNGKAYISLFLVDNTGSIDARLWDNVDSALPLFENGDLVRVKGQVQLFQNRKQVIVHKVERAEAKDYKMSDYVSTASRSSEEMMVELLKIASEMQDQNLRQLTCDVLSDPDIRARMLLAPAAKTIHHAYVGGLLEHILSICGWMKFLVAHYKAQQVQLRMDLLIFGAIFHDIGKIWELEVANGITYTDKGKLLGHMIMAIELVERKAARILGFPEELKDLLKHIILSHHGRLEYGSPKTPVFLEAFIVAAIDDLDSKINTVSRFIESERASGDKWSKFNPMFERYFHLKV